LPLIAHTDIKKYHNWRRLQPKRRIAGLDWHGDIDFPNITSIRKNAGLGVAASGTSAGGKKHARAVNNDGMLQVMERFSKKDVLLLYKGTSVDMSLEARLPVSEAVHMFDMKSDVVLQANIRELGQQL
jgi:hypothetical protein